MNAMVTQYDKGVFGEDSYEFRPERWLCGEEQWRIMDKAMLVFGAGTRTCIGKHVRLRSWKYYLKKHSC
jgi:cytochrome P450